MSVCPSTADLDQSNGLVSFVPNRDSVSRSVDYLIGAGD
jgi:hypothetical protein